MYGARRWNHQHHFCGNQFSRGWHGYGYGHRHPGPFFFPVLLIFGFLLFSGILFKLLFFVALFAIPAVLFARHAREYDYDEDGSIKRKNDDKSKRGDDPFYQDIEII